MKQPWLILLVLLVALAGGAQTVQVTALQKPFEAAVREAQQQQRDKLKALNGQYREVLAVAEQKMQERGSEPGLTWVRAERKRFEAAGTLPDDALAAPSPLRSAQEAWQQQTQAAKVEAARCISALTSAYLQQLAKLQMDFTVTGSTAGLEAAKNETERVLDNGVIRDALALAKTAPGADEKAAAEPAKPPTPGGKQAPAAGAGDYKFYAPGKEPAVKDLKSLRLEFPNAAARGAAAAFSLSAGVFADKEKLESNRQNAGFVAYKRERDLIHTQARLTLTAHGRELAAGSQLVVHYFSHPSSAPSEFHEERVELIALPALARGQTVSVDGEGIALGRFEHRGTFNRFRGGDEFYGLIVSLFDADGKLLIQQCSSTALAKACPAKLPTEKTQEPQRGHFGGGGPP